MPGMTDTSKPTNAPVGAAGVGKRKTDWEAVERDYRTGAFTLREMADKYTISHQAISKQAKNKGWPQDLSIAIRQATKAKLVEELVAKEVAKNESEVAKGVAKGCHAVVNTVLAVAELNKQVIMSHRSRLTELADAVDYAKGVLLAQGANIENIRDASTLVQAVGSLATATKTLIDKERESYTLNDKPEETPEKNQSRYTDAERAVKLAYLLSKVPA